MNVDHLLKQTCTIATAGGVDKFGKNSHATGRSANCRFQRTTRIIATVQKEREPINGILWFSADTIVDINDKITFQNHNYRVMQIEPIIDGAGSTRHKEILLQDWNN